MGDAHPHGAPVGPSMSQITKISPYHGKNPYTEISRTLRILASSMNGRNVPEEVAAAVLQSGGRPLTAPMSADEREDKINVLNHRSEQSFNKPGEDFRIALLSKMYKQSRQRAKELGIKNLEDGAKNSAIPLKAHGQQAARVYQAISSLLYSSINLYKSEELEKFVTKRSSTLPGSIFDLSHWQAAIDVARDVRNKGIGKDTWTGAATRPKEAWMSSTPGPRDTRDSSRSHSRRVLTLNSREREGQRERGGTSNGIRFDTTDLGADWEDDEESVDVGTMRFGAGLEEEEEEEEAVPPVNNNWVQSPPNTAGRPQRPQAARQHRSDSPPLSQSPGKGKGAAGPNPNPNPSLVVPPLRNLLEELRRLETQLQGKDVSRSKNQLIHDAVAVRQLLQAAQAQISQFMNIHSQAVPLNRHLRELSELRAESNMQLQMLKQSFTNSVRVSGTATAMSPKIVSVTHDAPPRAAGTGVLGLGNAGAGASQEVQALNNQLQCLHAELNAAREIAAKDISAAQAELQDMKQLLLVQTDASSSLSSQVSLLKSQLAHAEAQSKAAASLTSAAQAEDRARMKASENAASVEDQVSALNVKLANVEKRSKRDIADITAVHSGEVTALKSKVAHAELRLKAQADQHADTLRDMDHVHKLSIKAEQVTRAEIDQLELELNRTLAAVHHPIHSDTAPRINISRKPDARDSRAHANIAKSAVHSIVSTASANHMRSRSPSPSPAQMAVTSIIVQASENHVRTQSPHKDAHAPSKHTLATDVTNKLSLVGIGMNDIPAKSSHGARASLLHRHHHEISTKAELKTSHANDVLEHIREQQKLRVMLSDEVSKCTLLKIDNDALTTQLEQARDVVNRLRQHEQQQLEEMQVQLLKETDNLRKTRDDRDAQLQEVARLSQQLTEDSHQHIHLEKTISNLRHSMDEMENRHSETVYRHAHAGASAEKDESAKSHNLRDLTELIEKLKAELSSKDEHGKSLEFRISADLNLEASTEQHLKSALSREKELVEKLREESNENRMLKSALVNLESMQQKAATPEKAAAALAAPHATTAPDRPTSPQFQLAGKVAHGAIHGALRNHASPQQPSSEKASSTTRPTSAVKGSRSTIGSENSARRISFSVEVTDGYIIGAKVSANFGKSGQWYSGTIAKVHGSGAARSFDVSYDDGDAEIDKPLIDVKVLPAAAATAEAVGSSEELLALRAEVKELKSKVSLLEMTVRAKTQDLESLNKEFLSDAQEIDKQQKAAEKKLKAAEEQAAASFAEIVLLKSELDDAKIAISAAESAKLTGGKFRPDSSLDSIGNGSVGSAEKDVNKAFNPNASLQSISSAPSERDSIVMDAKTSADIISRYEARLATVEASNYQKLNTMKAELIKKDKTINSMEATLTESQKSELHTLQLLRNLEVKQHEGEETLQEQRHIASELQLKLNATIETLRKSEPPSIRSSPLMQEQDSKEAKKVEQVDESPVFKERVLWRPREEGESTGRRLHSATASKEEKRATVHMQRLVRGFLGRLAAKHVIIERSAKMHGILVAFRPAGTVQGHAGWYVAKGDLFYFALDKGEFVLVAGPLSAKDYDAILLDMKRNNIITHSEFSGEIDVDRMGLHAVRWQLMATKQQLDDANYELSPDGALHKYIDALKLDARAHAKQVTQLNEKDAALQASIAAKEESIAQIGAVAQVEKEKTKQIRAEMRTLKQELEIERMGSKTGGSEQQLYSPRGGESALVMTQAKAQVIHSAKKLQANHFVSIVIFQAYVRRFLIARRLLQNRIRELARQTSVLMALPGTVQGKAGWYVAPDGYFYFFVQRHNEWIMAAGPLDEDKYYEVLDMSVRVVPGSKYARVTSRPVSSKRNRITMVKRDSSLNMSMVGKKKGHHVSTVSNALIKCNFELSVERADLDGDVFMDKKTKSLYLAVSVERLIHHSALFSNAAAVNALR